MCANSIVSILRGVPGFEEPAIHLVPIKLGEAFGELPGVTTRIVTEENDNLGQHNVILVDKNGRKVN